MNESLIKMNASFLLVIMHSRDPLCTFELPLHSRWHDQPTTSTEQWLTAQVLGVDNLASQALLVQVAPVDLVLHGLVPQQPVDEGFPLLPVPEDPGNSLQPSMVQGTGVMKPKRTQAAPGESYLREFLPKPAAQWVNLLDLSASGPFCVFGRLILGSAVCQSSFGNI